MPECIEPSGPFRVPASEVKVITSNEIFRKQLLARHGRWNAREGENREEAPAAQASLPLVSFRWKGARSE